MRARCNRRPRVAPAGYDGHKRKKGSKTHMAVDTLGHLLAMVVTPANEQERAQVAALAAAVQEVTGEHVEVAYVDQGYTGEDAAAAAQRTASAGGGQAARGQTWLRPLATALGRRTQFRLGRALPAPGQGL